MSTAAVSNSSIFQELQSFFQSRQADLKQLSSALKSGDLNSAQQAYTSLAALGEGGPYANSEPFGKAGRAQAFDAVGEALQAGDLARAQAAFATLTAGPGKATASAVPAAVVDFAGPPTNTAGTVDTPPSIYQQLRAYQQQRHADIVQLGKDLQAGDLKAAQQDFNTLTTIGQSGPNKNGLAFQQDNRAGDLQAIGQALQSGDLAGAQSAFASLQGTFGKQNQQAQTAISAYNSGVTEIVINLGAPAASSAGSASSTPASSTEPVTTSTTPEIVINFGQGSNSSSASSEEITINFGSGTSAPQVSIEASQGQNGSSADQITIELNRQNTNNYELILNLLNSGSTSQEQSNSGNALSVSA
jgi:hypothetical protein